MPSLKHFKLWLIDSAANVLDALSPIKRGGVKWSRSRSRGRSRSRLAYCVPHVVVEILDLFRGSVGGKLLRRDALLVEILYFFVTSKPSPPGRN
jgi:hypothetical protein